MSNLLRLEPRREYLKGTPLILKTKYFKKDYNNKHYIAKQKHL
jgi:hypothetical protein